MYLEPCCIENQLPALLRKERGNALFQTNGDVTIEKLMAAACCMASGGFGEYWILIKEVDIQLMRYLRHWFSRGWIRELRLLTATDQTATVTAELGEWMSHTEYCWREGLGMELFAVIGDRESIVVQGDMLLVPRATAVMTAYSAVTGSNPRMLASDGAVGSIVENLRAVMRVEKRKAERTAAAAKAAEASEGGADDKAGADVATDSVASEAIAPEGEAVSSEGNANTPSEAVAPDGSADAAADAIPSDADETRPDTSAEPKRKPSKKKDS